MSIEVSDGTVWDAVFGVVAAGLGFAGFVWWQISDMSSKLKNHDERLTAIDGAMIEASKKTSATHDIVVSLNTSMTHMEKDVREIKDAFLTLVRDRVK